MILDLIDNNVFLKQFFKAVYLLVLGVSVLLVVYIVVAVFWKIVIALIGLILFTLMVESYRIAPPFS